MTGAFGPSFGQAAPFGPAALDAINEQVRRNTEMFEQAMRMFLPLPGGKGEGPTPPTGGTPSPEKGSGDIETLRRDVEEMQKRLEKLSGKSGS